MNILVYSDNKDEHEAHLQQVFDQLCKHKLQAKIKKCESGKMHIKYLGHVVDLGKLRVDRYKVAAISKCKPPSDIKDV